ncbi:hypothetical protein BKA82DRAFT_2993061 [Pisolithus tinctorius]|nr:hypothetical protein BKA82DRAFT_2993061 [Pisolithus tinctorius]
MSNPISVRLNLLLHHSRSPPVLSRLPGAQPDPNLSVPASSLWIPPPVQPHLMMPADLPGFHEFPARTEMELHETGTFDNRVAYILSDHPLPALPDHSAGMTSGGVANHGKINGSKCSADKVDLHVQSSLLPKKFPSSRREPCSLDHLCHVEGEGGDVSGPRTSRRLPKTRLVCDRIVSKLCGWRDDNGTKCGAPITYDCANHFAVVHGVENIARDIKIICRWCPTKKQRKVIRKNILRHLREVHLRYSRSTRTKR